MPKLIELYEKSDIIKKWRLREYVSPNGRRSITDWRAKFPAGLLRAFMDRFLNDLVKKKEWQFPDIDGLTGASYQGLSELRWKCGKVPYRIIGYTVSDHIFLMLIGCTHNKKKYKPTDCLDTAVKRKKEIESGEATNDAYQLITNSGNGV